MCVVCVHVCVCASVCVCVLCVYYVCARACARACVRSFVCVRSFARPPLSACARAPSALAGEKKGECFRKIAACDDSACRLYLGVALLLPPSRAVV